MNANLMLWGTIMYWAILEVVVIALFLIAVCAWPRKMVEHDEHEDAGVG